MKHSVTSTHQSQWEVLQWSRLPQQSLARTGWLREFNRGRTSDSHKVIVSTGNLDIKYSYNGEPHQSRLEGDTTHRVDGGPNGTQKCIHAEPSTSAAQTTSQGFSRLQPFKLTRNWHTKLLKQCRCLSIFNFSLVNYNVFPLPLSLLYFSLF